MRERWVHFSYVKKSYQPGVERKRWRDRERDEGGKINLRGGERERETLGEVRGLYSRDDGLNGVSNFWESVLETALQLSTFCTYTHSQFIPSVPTHSQYCIPSVSVPTQ